MITFLLGVAVGFFGVIAWINRAWVMEQIRTFKWVDK
jgi:hypothetical protein